LIGYGYSSPPPTDKEFTTGSNAPIFNAFMEGLGLKGYIAQGGDVGSAVSRFLADFDSCKGRSDSMSSFGADDLAIHLNMWVVQPAEEDQDPSKFDDLDKQALELLNDNKKWGFAYNHEHATKTSTIAIVVSSNPVSLLAWIGEKMLAWAHEETRPSLELILANVTLYWITKSYPTGLYQYRTTNGKSAITRKANKPGKTSKPAGYSHFVHELLPTPISWVEKSGDANLVWSKRHERVSRLSHLPVETADKPTGWPFRSSRSPRGLLGGYQRVCRKSKVAKSKGSQAVSLWQRCIDLRLYNLSI
jgi:microsomal epoxide hydrolase